MRTPARIPVPDRRRFLRSAGWSALALSGCISFGADPPDVLLNLTPTTQAAAGTGVSGTSDTALALLDLPAVLETGLHVPAAG